MNHIHCDTITQFKVLRHLQREFEPSGVKQLELIEDGIRLTDCTGASADFVYNTETCSIELYEDNQVCHGDTLKKQKERKFTKIKKQYNAKKEK